MIYITLANGFEEIEALAFFDILKRAEIDCELVSINEDNYVTGAHGVRVCTDININDVKTDIISAVVLPGGMPGTINLKNSEKVLSLINYCFKNEKIIGAICAAPSVLGYMGILKGKKATCFPGFEKELTGAEVTGEKVVRDGLIITAKGAGCAHEFAFEFVKVLKSKSLADNIKNSMQY